MADPRNRLYVAMLDGADYAFLSKKYDMSTATLGLWQDSDWCEFLNCVPEELPYYLLGDVEPQVIDDAEFEFEPEEPDDEDEFDRARRTGRSMWDEEEDDEFAYLGGSHMVPHGAHFGTIGSGSTTRFANTHYGQPSTRWPNYSGGFSTRGLRPEDIPHHFEVVK